MLLLRRKKLFGSYSTLTRAGRFRLLPWAFSTPTSARLLAKLVRFRCVVPVPSLWSSGHASRTSRTAFSFSALGWSISVL